MTATLLRRITIGATVAQILATIVSLIVEDNPNESFLAATSVVHMILFVGGVVALFTGFLKGLGRSRTREISVGGLFFLSGQTAPASDRRLFLGCLGVQVLTGIIGASLAPLTAVAFTSLAPAAGFGCLALYGAYLGIFPERENSTRVDA